MKKILLAAVVGGSLFTSCTVIDNAKQAQKEKSQFLKMKGDWVITNVSHNKGFKVKPFDEGVEAKCFEGSQWKLIPNNYKGSYTLTDCKSVTQPIKFDIVDENTFQFKKIHTGVKAKSVIAGYKLTLIDRTENTFSLKQTIPFNGEMINVIYQFQKVQ